MSRINELQNSAEGLNLRHAAQGAHRVAQRAATLGGVVSLFLMLLAVAATIFRPIAAWVAIAATIWAFLDFFGLDMIVRRANDTAALIQEKLDTWLYDMKWDSSIGQPPPPEEINKWARKADSSEAESKDWYPRLEGIPRHLAVLACQRVNLLWDLRLRSRYATALQLGVIAWTAVGILVGLLGDLGVREITLSWFVPSTPAFIRALREARAHRDVVEEKEKLFESLRPYLEGLPSQEATAQEVAMLAAEARRVQSCIYALRRRTERVPRRLYERFRPQDEADTTRAVVDLRRSLGQSLRPDRSQ